MMFLARFSAIKALESRQEDLFLSGGVNG